MPPLQPKVATDGDSGKADSASSPADDGEAAGKAASGSKAATADTAKAEPLQQEYALEPAAVCRVGADLLVVTSFVLVRSFRLACRLVLGAYRLSRVGSSSLLCCSPLAAGFIGSLLRRIATGAASPSFR